MGRGGAMVRFMTVLVVGDISPMGSRSIEHNSLKRNILNSIDFSVNQEPTSNFLWPLEPIYKIHLAILHVSKEWEKWSNSS